MEGYIIAIIVVLVIGAIVLYQKYRKHKKATENSFQVYSDTYETTPKGLTIFSKSGVSERFKTWADESLDTLFADARSNGYVGKLGHGSYVVYALHNCVPSPETRTPSFLVDADNYDGTGYDQDPEPGSGKVFAAEMVISEQMCQYVVCISDDETYVKNAIRYGAEHIILYHNDLAKYQETKTHISSGHPLIMPIGSN